MVELIEYALAVMASTLFVAGSVLVYGAYSSFESGLSLHAGFDAISGLALKAEGGGIARATMSLPSSTISCEHGALSFSVGSASQTVSLPVDFSFSMKVSAGLHTLIFIGGPTLALTVT
jgi:hypothetical protein